MTGVTTASNVTGATPDINMRRISYLPLDYSPRRINFTGA